ncbi:MAG: zinc ribbon domain-containing protein [Cytophagales bacterium]|nr:zinc ribbon domain-containing protein [Cytophagales bacterium]
MIIYGWRSAHVRTTQSKTATCPHCGTRGSIITSIFSRYAHIFWIPLFPFGKTGASQCQHCHNAMKVNEMPEEIKREYRDLKSEARTPIWQFSGLVLIVMFVTWMNFTNKENEKTELEYISSPLKGDIYEYETESSNYSTLKVVEVTDDSIFVAPNEYETTKMAGVYEIDEDANYPDVQYGLSRAEVKNMYDDGVIYDVKRK